MKKKAILFCENNENIEVLAEYLTKSGWDIFSGGETGQVLKANGIPFKEVTCFEGNTNADGEFSLLIYKIGITGRDVYASEKSENDIPLVCVNLKPSLYKISDFYDIQDSNTLIDVKHSFLMKAACKNFQSVMILCDPKDYNEAIIQLRTDNITDDFKIYLAGKALNFLASYNSGISASIQLARNKSSYPEYFNFPYENSHRHVKHGINRQQTANLYKLPDYKSALSGFSKIQGNEPSYNTLINIHQAWKVISHFIKLLKYPFSVESCNCEGYPYITQFSPMAGFVFTVGIKNASTIGAAVGDNVMDSLKKTYSCDTEAFENAILGSSAVIDEISAREIKNLKIRSIVAPGFTKEACQVLSENKDIRLFSASNLYDSPYEFTSLNGGVLVQSTDSKLFDQWNVVTQTRPDQWLVDSMALGMMICLSTKSYSAVVVKNQSAIGISTGQASVRKAVLYALNDSKELLNSVDNIAEVLVCDSVIHFDDRLRCIADFGVRAIIQTGGSTTDPEFIQYCNERGICMVFTGMQHLAY